MNELNELRKGTGAGEADDGGRQGLGVDDDELERRVGAEGGEEVVESPLQSVGAVLALVRRHNHHLLLRH